MRPLRLERFAWRALCCACLGLLCACDASLAWNTPAPAGKARAGRPPAPAARTPFGQDPAQYVLTFAEEFDTYTPHHWNDHLWYEYSNPTRNYAVEDGRLKIWPERDASGAFFKRTLDTDGKFSQTYGYFEMEAKLPRGKGVWPAFWLFAHPGERRPEIDIMEAYPGGVSPWGMTGADGQPYPRAYGITVWLDQGNEAGRLQYDAHQDLSAGFHKYAVRWEPDRQTFFFDGKRVLSVDVSMSDPMYLLLDLWFGSASGTPDATTPQGRSNAFEVNYVRVWQFRNRFLR